MTVHVQQRGPHDCAIAACAMLTGMTYESVLALFSDWTEWNARAVAKGERTRGTDERHYSKFFDEIGWQVRGPIGGWRNPNAGETIRDMLWGRRALISIHSANHDAGYHTAYFDGARIWDPQEGRDGHRAYGPMLWSVPIRCCWIFAERPLA